jgi:hypothetical protein
MYFPLTALYWVALSSLWFCPSVLAEVSEPAPAPSVAAVAPREFHDEIERDFALRSIGQIQITNMRGDIAIQGWSLDKIRVKAHRKALASTPDEAKRLFSAVDFRYKAIDGLIELSAEYGRGLSLDERLREREHPRTAMQMTVFAPAGLKLRVWGVDGKIIVKGWSTAVDARASSGAINIENVKSGGASVLCPACSIQLKSVKGAVRTMGGTGTIQLTDIDAPQTYVETGSGAISAFRVNGEQLYVSKDGPISGRELAGRIEFHGGSGPVEILESTGFLSGRTTAGSILARMREWRFADKAVIESIGGDIRLSLPADFSGDVDLHSGLGKAEIGFPVELSEDRPRPEASSSPGRITGRVGEGGELLKIFTSRGKIQVLKGG